MPCKVVDLGNGVTAIVKMARQRKKACLICGQPGSKLCDYPLTGAKAGKTCDRSLCEKCAVKTGPDTDLCPAHFRMTKEFPKRPGGDRL